MSYVVTWAGPMGRERKKASTAAIALGYWNTYSRDASNFVVKDEAGTRVTIDDLRKLAEG